jgi:hypothetical protein
VKVSSTMPLSSPVLRHCCTNSFCERLAIRAVTTIEIGTVTRAMRASTHEIQNIMTRTATTVSSELSSCERVCCRDWLTLSMSLVTRLSTSPRGCLSK